MEEIKSLIIPENSAKNQQEQKPVRVIGRPFQPGQSGNPKGKPPGTVSITTEIKNTLKKIYPTNKLAKITGDDGKKILHRKKTYLQMVIEAIFDNAIKEKDARTLNQIWAYVDGHPKATIDIGADKDSLIELTEIFRGIAIKGKNKK